MPDLENGLDVSRWTTRCKKERASRKRTFRNGAAVGAASASRLRFITKATRANTMLFEDVVAALGCADIAINTVGKVLTLVMSLPEADTPFYSTYPGSKAAVLLAFSKAGLTDIEDPP